MKNISLTLAVLGVVVAIASRCPFGPIAPGSAPRAIAQTPLYTQPITPANDGTGTIVTDPPQSTAQKLGLLCIKI